MKRFHHQSLPESKEDTTYHKMSYSSSSSSSSQKSDVTDTPTEFIPPKLHTPDEIDTYLTASLNRTTETWRQTKDRSKLYADLHGLINDVLFSLGPNHRK